MLLWLCMGYTWWSCNCFLQGSEYVCFLELELSEEIFDHNEPNLICNCCTMLQLQLAIFFLLPRWLFSILEIFVCFSKNTFLFLYKNWCKVIFDLYAHFFNSWRKLSSVVQLFSQKWWKFLCLERFLMNQRKYGYWRFLFI